MKLLNRLQRRFGDLAIANLTIYLIFFQVCAFLLCKVQPELREKLILTHESLFAGQWWRIVTMVALPALDGWGIFLIFFLYIFYMMGSALEAQWGTFRYNVYLLVGYLATIAAALVPHAVLTNAYLLGSVFLAFAWLYPDYELLLFLFFPCKVKWLALLSWIGYLLAFLNGGWDAKAQVAAGALNFVLFFHADLWAWLATSRRKLKNKANRMQAARDVETPMHVCALCGVTDQSDRKMEFRYCPQCTGTPAYCINHIHNHQHR